MSFLMPKTPKVVSTPAATPATQADATLGTTTAANNTSLPGSMISTSAQGLTKKARTQKPSLIGESVAN